MGVLGKSSTFRKIFYQSSRRFSTNHLGDFLPLYIMNTQSLKHEGSRPPLVGGATPLWKQNHLVFYSKSWTCVSSTIPPWGSGLAHGGLPPLFLQYPLVHERSDELVQCSATPFCTSHFTPHFYIISQWFFTPYLYAYSYTPWQHPLKTSMLSIDFLVDNLFISCDNFSLTFA